MAIILIPIITDVAATATMPLVIATASVIAARMILASGLPDALKLWHAPLINQKKAAQAQNPAPVNVAHEAAAPTVAAPTINDTNQDKR